MKISDDLDDVLKIKALEEFSDTLSLLNLLTSIDCDRVSLNFRIMLLQARHSRAFQLMMAKWKPRWFKSSLTSINKDRVRLVEALCLDWAQQPAEVTSLRARLNLRKMLEEGLFPEELTDDEVAIFQQVQINHIVQESLVVRRMRD